MKHQLLNASPAKRSAEPRWPTGSDNADRFAHKQIFIKAPCSTASRVEIP